ncbi:MAG: FAD-binding protein, partial [Litorimonas sp.]
MGHSSIPPPNAPPSLPAPHPLVAPFGRFREDALITAIGTLDRKRLPAGSVLVVGAGLAGLYLALKLAPRPVYVLTSRRSSKGAASAWAQGG